MANAQNGLDDATHECHEMEWMRSKKRMNQVVDTQMSRNWLGVIKVKCVRSAHMSRNGMTEAGTNTQAQPHRK